MGGKGKGRAGNKMDMELLVFHWHSWLGYFYSSSGHPSCQVWPHLSYTPRQSAQGTHEGKSTEAVRQAEPKQQLLEHLF
jgi:hypothetical protein